MNLSDLVFVKFPLVMYSQC